MDRLRALQYFIVAAEEGSLSAAARRLEVSVPAVAKLVGALERDLGVALFERSAQGLALTTSGEGYLASCRPAVAALRDIDEQVRVSTGRARGTVVVGVQHVVARTLLAPALPRFHARHPDIHLDLRESTQMVEPDAPGVDVYLSFAWPKAQDMVHRALGVTHFAVCAAPAYWARKGVPRHPSELQAHDALLIRTQRGTAMDLWSFARGDERVDVTMKGWLVVNNAHRDVAIDLALAGQGVVRILDWSERPRIAEGALVQVLTDWTCTDAPPAVLSYRPSAKRQARVRAFVDFVLEVFREIEHPAGRRPSIGHAPFWAGSDAPRASAIAPSRRR